MREPRVRLDGGAIEGIPQASAKDQAKPAGRAVALLHHEGNHLDVLLVTILSFEPTVCKHGDTRQCEAQAGECPGIVCSLDDSLYARLMQNTITAALSIAALIASTVEPFMLSRSNQVR